MKLHRDYFYSASHASYSFTIWKSWNIKWNSRVLVKCSASTAAVQQTGQAITCPSPSVIVGVNTPGTNDNCPLQASYIKLPLVRKTVRKKSWGTRGIAQQFLQGKNLSGKASWGKAEGRNFEMRLSRHCCPPSWQTSAGFSLWLVPQELLCSSFSCSETISQAGADVSSEIVPDY